MSDPTDRPMPAKPGWWWRRCVGDLNPSLCYRSIVRGTLAENDGTWLREIPSPERIAALEECAAELKMAQCACSTAERESGHRVGCWRPQALEALDNLEASK